MVSSEDVLRWGLARELERGGGAEDAAFPIRTSVEVLGPPADFRGPEVVDQLTLAVASKDVMSASFRVPLHHGE